MMSITEFAQQKGLKLDDIDLAKALDTSDSLSHLRSQFLIPTKGDLVPCSATGGSRQGRLQRSME
jgi:hypothetical protein